MWKTLAQAKFITRHEEIIMNSKVVLADTSTDYFVSKLLVSSQFNTQCMWFSKTNKI